MNTTQQKKNSSLLNLLFVLLAIYSVYGIAIDYLGNSVVKFFQLALLGVLLLFFVKHIGSVFSCRYTRISFLLGLVISLSFFVFSDGDSTTQFKCVLYLLLVPIPFMYETIDYKKLIILLIVVFIGQIGSFFYSLANMRLLNEDAYGGGYYSLVTMPIGLFLLRNAKLKYKYAFILVIFVLVLLSVKRGDILGCIFGSLLYLVSSLEKNKISAKTIAIAMFVCLIGYYIFNYFLATNELISMRFEQTQDGNSSERDVIYSSIWNHFINDASWSEKIFGGGFDNSLRIAYIRAHSDWLEILTSSGLIGVFIYFLYYMSLYKMRRTLNANAEILTLILGILFVKSLVSMCIYSAPTIYVSMVIGLLLNPQFNVSYEKY